MSPRSDSYLSLCLEQASKSTLHYRHGCIVVKGGKVIGSGYNHYRPGFNGGALKTGKLTARGASNNLPVLELRQMQKRRLKSQQYNDAGSVERNYEKELDGASTFTFCPLENSSLGCSNSGGHLANTPLSMHSEMMAIHSALSLSGTLASQGSARSARWLVKPYFKLPGGGKRPLCLRGLKAYMEAVCDEQAGVAHESRGKRYSGESQVQGSRFEGTTSQRRQGQGVQRKQRQRQRRGEVRGMESQTEGEEVVFTSIEEC